MSSARPLRAVRYMRVSRLDQDPQLQDDETKDLEAYCKSLGPVSRGRFRYHSRFPP